MIHCPDLIEEGPRGAELRTFAAVLAAVEELCPWVTPVRLGICTIPARGPSRLLGGEGAMLHALRAQLGAVALDATPQLGIAPGLFGAQLAAREGEMVDQDDLSSFLAPWPVSVLGRSELASVLPRIGVRTLGQFASLGHREVFARFGTDAAACHSAASGEVGELVGLRDAGIARRLAAVLGPVLPAAVQPSFYGGTGSAERRAANSATRLQQWLGPEAVVVARPQGGRNPSDQAELVPFGSWPVDGRSKAAPWPGQLPPPAPITVFGDPRVVEVFDSTAKVITVSRQGFLTAVPDHCAVEGGRLRRIASWAGPWPVAERWWVTPRRRVRLQVVTESGQAILLVFEQQQWWLEAVYD